MIINVFVAVLSRSFDCFLFRSASWPTLVLARCEEEFFAVLFKFLRYITDVVIIAIDAPAMLTDANMTKYAI